MTKRRSSLAVKVPLALSVLLATALGSMTVAVYFEMRASVMSAASDRLANAGSQLSNLLANSVRQRSAALQNLSRQEVIVEAFTDAVASPEGVRQPLSRYLGLQSTIAAVELLNPLGGRMVTAGANYAELSSEAKTALFDTIRATQRPAVSQFSTTQSYLEYAVAAPVRQANGLVGYVVDRRRLVAPSMQAMNVVTGLIGDGAHLLVGDGASWSDLTTIVDAPIATLATSMALAEYDREGVGAVFARAARIPDTPWFVVVELPRAAVLAPASRFLQRATGLSLILVATAALGGWTLSRRLTTPLRRVADAAEAIAADLPAERLALARDDEIGRLAMSFNTMADRVAYSRQRFEALVRELELRVEARTSELRTANADLESFSYSVSHDLQAPLRAIGGFARILGEDYREQLPADAGQCLDAIDRNIRHMEHLIDDLLTLSRLGRQSLTRRPVDMQALVTNIVAEMQRAEASRALQFSIRPMPEAMGESSLIHQVWLNLLSNALKFTRGRIPAVIEVGAKEDNGERVYYVRDNGAGFDMRYAKKLFGVFQRLHRASEFEGSGVGLAIVHRVVHRHGGRAWAEGAVDGGATFYFTLTPRDCADGADSHFHHQMRDASTDHQTSGVGLAVDNDWHDRGVGHAKPFDPSHA